MHIGSVEQNIMLDLLQLMQGIVEKKSLNPVLSTIILSTSSEDNTFEIQATNMEESIKVRSHGDFNNTTRFAIPFTRLGDFVKELSSGPINLEIEDEANLFKVAQGRATAHLPLLSLEEFPTLPTPPDTTLSLSKVAFLKVLSKVSFSIAIDSISTALKGLLIRKKGATITFVATDGHRLSLLENEYERLPQGELEIIVPRKGIQEVKRFVSKSVEDTLEMGTVHNHLYISTDRGEIFVRLLDAKYPNYEKVIPQEFTSKAVISREELIRSVRRASLFSSDRVRGIKLRFSEGSLLISSIVSPEEPFSGSAQEEVDLIEFDGEKVELGLNARYILDVLVEVDDDRVVMEMGNSMWPVRITAPGTPEYLHVVMPLQLEEMER